jgi:hypothetical protein
LIDNSDHRIVALVSPRCNETDPDSHNGRVLYHKYDLSKPLSSEIQSLIRNADTVLHFAWTRGADFKTVNDLNISMIKNLMAPMPDPSSFFFISSVADSPNTLSTYGITKHNCSKYVRQAGGSVLVCGLVVTPDPSAGSYRMLYETLKKYPVAVSISRGEPAVFPIRLIDLVKTIMVVCNSKLDPEIYKMYGEGIEFNRFVNLIEELFPKKRIRIRFNVKFLLKTAAFLKKSKLAPVKICDQILTFFYKDADYLNSHQDIANSEIQSCNDSSFLSAMD